MTSFLTFFTLLTFSSDLYIVVLIIIFLISLLNLYFYVKNNKRLLKYNLISNKILLGITIVFSIPNKILINNGMPIISSTVIFVLFVIYSFSKSFIFFIVFCYYIVLLLASLIFGLTFEKSKKFQMLLVRNFFSNNFNLLQEYINYFFGNPSNGT